MEVVALGEVCDLNPPPLRKLRGDESCSFVPMEAVDETSGRIARLVSRRVHEVAKGYTAFAENDVLVAKITPCMENGKCAVARRLQNGIGFGSTEFHVLRPTGAVTSEWLFYFWRRPEIRSQAERNMTGSAGQKRVPESFLKTLDIPLPNYQEQKRIVAILDRTERLRRMRRYTLELGNTFLPAAFLGMFGDPKSSECPWPLRPLGDLCERVTVGFVGTMVSEYVVEGIPLLRSLNVRRNRIATADLKFISEKFHQKIAKSSLRPGDVVAVRTGKPGVSAVVPESLPVANCSDLIVMTCTDGLRPRFLSELLNIALGDAEEIRGTTGAIQTHFNIERAKELMVPVPPIALQDRFVSLAASHERAMVGYRESLRQADHLFQSLLHHAFAASI